MQLCSVLRMYPQNLIVMCFLQHELMSCCISLSTSMKDTMNLYILSQNMSSVKIFKNSTNASSYLYHLKYKILYIKGKIIKYIINK